MYSLPPGSLGVTGQTILAQTHNRPVQDIEQALSVPYLRDGRAPMTGNIPMNGYQAKNGANATEPQDFVTLAQVQALIDAVSLLYPGFQMVDTITSTTAPQGWVYANGQELVRTTYPALWARVSAGNNLAATQGAKTHGQYGPGNGTTTFTVPNMYGASTADGGYFIRAVSSGRGIGTIQVDAVGIHNHSATFIGDAVPPHTHPFTAFGGGTGGAVNPAADSRSSGFGYATQPSGGHTPSGKVTVQNSFGPESRPINIAYPVLIKT